MLLLLNLCLGQTAFMQLKPGASLQTDADRELGQPVTKVSETLFEYKATQSGQKVYVQFAKASCVIDRIVVVFEKPIDRATLASLMGVGTQADTTKWDAKGRLEEYFGTTKLVVLTHETSDATSLVMRVGYYSRELFASALEKPKGTPQSLAPSLTASKSSTPRAKTKAVTFGNVDLLVPKGDKSDEKSVRLLFDGDTLVIDADKGEKIYKSFPYSSIKSAEYSYSSQPRWKTAIGATILLGVFALPLFFMKGKKHWLTIKTANDFAILHLDKNNYKIILPTFETSTGKKVETVADEK